MYRLTSMTRFLMALLLTMGIGAFAGAGPAQAEAGRAAVVVAGPLGYVGCVGYCSYEAYEQYDRQSLRWAFYNGCMASCLLY
jgi:hypothetical protein